jgi:hypothetical protein
MFRFLSNDVTFTRWVNSQNGKPYYLYLKINPQATQLHGTYSQWGIRGCMQKFTDWVDNEIHAYNNEHLLRSKTKGYGGKTH